MDLGFQNIAEQEFEFLQLEYGFNCVKSGPYLVRYQSKDVFVNIYYDGNRSYELGCTIGRNDDYLDTRSVPFDLGEIVRCKAYPRKNVNVFCQVTNISDLEKYTKEISNLLKVFCHDILTGTKSSYDAVADFRNSECEIYYHQKERVQLQSELDVAWKKRNYEKVIELLNPHKEHLDRLTLKKLEYAIKIDGKK